MKGATCLQNRAAFFLLKSIPYSAPPIPDHTGEDDRQHLPDAGPDFDVAYACHQAAVGDDVAPGRL